MAGLANFALLDDSVEADAVGPLKVHTVTFTGVSDYTSGGDTGFKAGMRTLLGSAVTPVAVIQVGSGGDLSLVYKPKTDVLKVITQSTGVEASAHANHSSVTFTVTVISK
jgi:hypothetical protein